jgi:hypothetical protein
MSEREREPTPALAEARRRRADLHNALIEVEDTVSGPAAGRETFWTQEVIAALSRLRVTIEEHIEVTERTDGLYDEVLQRAPRMSGTVERLRSEHPVLRDSTSAMMAKLRTNPVGTTWTLQEAREELQALLGRMMKHRQQGADLVWEAFTMDIGGVE